MKNLAIFIITLFILLNINITKFAEGFDSKVLVITNDMGGSITDRLEELKY